MIPSIAPVSRRFALSAQKRWDNLIKPQGSLGLLEEIVCDFCAIRETDRPFIARKRLIVFAADHGIAAEGVSAYPREVTVQMVRGFLGGNAAICVLARKIGIELEIVDMGIADPVDHPSLRVMRAGYGTRNFLLSPAMTIEQTRYAIEAGIGFAVEAAKDHIDLLAGGDMGIGNTTAASAIFAALFDVDPALVTGKGTGISEEARVRKADLVRVALNKWRAPFADPLAVLRHYGGFEIAALTGLYLGAASHRLPVIVDGFICTAAAAVALSISPACRDYLFFAHSSAENGYDIVKQKLGLKPILSLDLRLGEGTGAAMAMQTIENAVALYNEMRTFQEAAVSPKIE